MAYHIKHRTYECNRCRFEWSTGIEPNACLKCGDDDFTETTPFGGADLDAENDRIRAELDAARATIAELTADNNRISDLLTAEHATATRLGAEVAERDGRIAELENVARAHKVYDLACQDPGWDWDKLITMLHDFRRLRDEAMAREAGGRG